MSWLNKILGNQDNATDKTTNVNKNALNWHTLTTEVELDAIIERSKTVACAIFKHSTRCSISSMAKTRLERNWGKMDEDKTIEIYYLDLIAYRSISNKIEEVLAVTHASPQILLLQNGEVTYHTSHSNISVEDLKEAI